MQRVRLIRQFVALLQNRQFFSVDFISTLHHHHHALSTPHLVLIVGFGFGVAVSRLGEPFAFPSFTSPSTLGSHVLVVL